MTVHWLGLGLSSYAGVRALADQSLVVWVRDRAKGARTLAEIGAPGARLAEYSEPSLAAALRPGDCVVSMFPAPMHPPIARVCLARGAHLVTTSYVSDAMRALDFEAAGAGVTLLNEVGLDPGLDHWMAHELFDRAGEALADARARSYSFVSVCGGFPEQPGPFKYRFSWSPAGVLRALRSPAQWIEGGQVRTSTMPARVTREIEIAGDRFEMYPNRDSLAYLASYAGAIRSGAETFLRGTLRPLGWTRAWSEILERLPGLDDAGIEALAVDLWRDHAYLPGEKDRVVLHCAVEVRDEAGRAFHTESLTLSECGAMPYGSAMNRLVSLPAAIGAREVLSGNFVPGVQVMPSDRASRGRWARALVEAGIKWELA
jgi:saccharopine dehydrogenase-like NADP-dependent oxidoreductase